MKVFHCDHCNHLVFFENFLCIRCGHQLAYLPDLGVTGSLDLAKDGLWRSPLPRAKGNSYRLCQNYTEHNVCNWAIPSDHKHEYCISCRLNKLIPNLSIPGHKQAWFKVEVTKRRLIYTRLSLKLPVVSKAEEPDTGLAFELLADPEDPKEPKVLTGHQNGVITLNIAEADDSERERRRLQLHESYRTLLGHMRHEIGHYYWDRLVADTEHLSKFRERFGDEREDYEKALQKHYKDGAPPDWQSRFISAYAASHAWEDWAETWAHYLHMKDMLETSLDCGLSLKPQRSGDPALEPDPMVVAGIPSVFDAMIDSWHPLTYVLNNLNRGMGLPDGYPFVLSAPVIEKLRFVHELIAASATE